MMHGQPNIKIFRMTLVRDLIQTSGAASTSDHMTRKTSPINEPTKRHDTQHNNGLWNVREFGAMCVLLKTQKKVQNSSVQTSMCLYASPCFEVYHTKQHF
jgi:hypothetical protein